MEYKVVPFNANLQQDDAVETSAYQLQILITKYQSEGWEFVSMGNIETNVAGTNGCLGIGAKPGYTSSVAVVVFKR